MLVCCRPTTARLTVYVVAGELYKEGTQVYTALYLNGYTFSHLLTALVNYLNMPQQHVAALCMSGPQGIHISVTDQVFAHLNIVKSQSS